MNEIFARILVGVCIGILFLLLLLCIIIYQINRKKALTGLVLTIIFAAITGYYCYLTLFPFHTFFGTISETTQNISQPSATFPPQQPSNQIILTVETNDGTKFFVENGDSLDIGSNVLIKITGVSQAGKLIENIRVNVIGFVPKNTPSTINDIGYWFSYKDMLKKFAIDDEKTVYCAEIKQNDEKLGEIYLHFTR